MSLETIIKKIIREEVEENTLLKTKLQDLVDKLGIEKAKNAVGGIENLVKILYGTNLKGYYQQNDIDAYYISSDTELYIDDLFVQSLDLPDIGYGSRQEKELGSFRWTSQGMNYRFDARLVLIKYYSGKKTWRVVGSSGDHGFGYPWISRRNTLGKRARLQIFKQIINKYNLNFYNY